MVQWLGFCSSTAKGLGSTYGWGTEIPKLGAMAKKKRKEDLRFRHTGYTSIIPLFHINNDVCCRDTEGCQKFHSITLTCNSSYH